jgi:hypothetical protein
MIIGNVAQATDCKLIVSVRDTGRPEFMTERRETLESAEALAGKMFRTIGIDVRWRNGAGQSQTAFHSCGAPILLNADASADGAPVSKGAFAYAIPFESSGTSIHMFMDRITGANGHQFTSVLLAHVMVHEITHVLEKTGEHSPDGIMKAHWEYVDLQHMRYHPLPFAQRDVDMIQMGLERHSQTALTE